MFKCRRKHRSHSTVFNDNQDIGGKLVELSRYCDNLLSPMPAHVAVKSIHGPYEPSRSAASLPYVHDPTEPHDYEKIPENSKLHNSNTEQVVKLTELCHSGLAKPCVDMEDHGYVISVSECYQLIVSMQFHCDSCNLENARFVITAMAMSTIMFVVS